MNPIAIHAVEAACVEAEAARRDFLTLPVETFHPADIGSSPDRWAIVPHNDTRYWVATVRSVRAHLERLRA